MKGVVRLEVEKSFLCVDGACVQLWVMCVADVCVCVCVPPWTKGLTPPLSHRQGMETPVLLLHQRSWQYMVRISVPDAELTYLL